jgi:hypothetical protein
MAPVLMALNSVAARAAAPKLSAKRALRAAAVQPARPAKVRGPRAPAGRAHAPRLLRAARSRGDAARHAQTATQRPSLWLGDDADQQFDAAALLTRRLPPRCAP